MADPQAIAFWTWFQANESGLFNLSSDQQVLLDELELELQKVHSDLTCEFSSIVDGRRELLLSAGGSREALPAVESLAATVPVLTRWTIQKFRPRCKPIHDLELEGVTVKADQVEFSIASDDGKIIVLIFFPSIEDKELQNEFAFSFLEEAIGEHDLHTKVSGVQIIPFSILKDYPRFPLAKLPEKFDELYRHLNRA